MLNEQEDEMKKKILNKTNQRTDNEYNNFCFVFSCFVLNSVPLLFHSIFFDISENSSQWLANVKSTTTFVKWFSSKQMKCYFIWSLFYLCLSFALFSSSTMWSVTPCMPFEFSTTLCWWRTQNLAVTPPSTTTINNKVTDFLPLTLQISIHVYQNKKLFFFSLSAWTRSLLALV